MDMKKCSAISKGGKLKIGPFLEHIRGGGTITMAIGRPENELERKTSKYRFPLIVAAAGLIFIVLGFIIPVLGWNTLLIWLGIILLLGASFSAKIWFIGDWIPTLFAENERGKGNDIPPPPTLERWP
jgi:hypothetical protein